MKKLCPRCGSYNITLEDYMGTVCVVCRDCGYDERESFDVFPEDKVSQKNKMNYSPYKTGGSKRSLKY